ncbi:hypothetical protein KC343_g326 [Hortaea werneckii]|nr:hypothetical protein KC352_g4333 [Hortaea werneckii]KAI7572906.1 hypothetical protein KC317_g352 [Hortaea werneckii]KAI7628237.1 hypothetical protein KC346_g307 [Hortaea werneckii]KAI7638069.1 hypothetical protein KC343_g326 [Hortaea werneckii]KAI7683762.1 hypothetical protein KC319_g301 [Hortaea werneckii]
MASQKDEKKIYAASSFGKDGMSLQHAGEQIGEAHSEPRQNVPVPADRESLGEGGGLLASPWTLQDSGDWSPQVALPSSTQSTHYGGVGRGGVGRWTTEDTQATSSASNGVASTGPSYTPQCGGPNANGQDLHLLTSSLAQTSQPQATQPQAVQQPMTPLEQRLLVQLNELSQSSDQVASGLIDLQGYAPVKPRPPPWAPTGSMSSPDIHRPSGLQLHASTYYFDPYPTDSNPRDMGDEVREDWTEFERKWDEGMEDAKYASDDLWCDGSTVLWILARLYGDGKGKR